MKYLFFTFAILFLLFACEKDDRQDQELEDLYDYLEENSIAVSPTPSGLYYIETEAGTGTQAQNTSTVSVNYTGYLISGDVFDTTEGGEPLRFTLGHDKVIEGFREGICLMRQGGTAQLIIPSKLAYGEESRYNIPPYSTLIFDVELLTVE